MGFESPKGLSLTINYSDVGRWIAHCGFDPQVHRFDSCHRSVNIWNGIIVPQVQKSIGTVRFIPLAQMTAENWKVLDYEALRETAINRLEQKARGRLIGFFEVTIVSSANESPNRLQKAGPAKSIYYVPVTREEFDDWEEGERPADFENRPDEDLTTAGVGFNNLVSAITLAIVLGGVAAVVAVLTDDTTSCSLEDEDEAQIQELLDLLASGDYFENLDPAYAGLAIALYLYGKCPVEFLQRVIDEFIESIESIELEQDEF